MNLSGNINSLWWILWIVTYPWIACSLFTMGATLKQHMLHSPISKRPARLVLLHLFLFQITLEHCCFGAHSLPQTMCFLIFPACIAFCTLSTLFFSVFGSLVLFKDNALSLIPARSLTICYVVVFFLWHLVLLINIIFIYHASYNS